ncbi:APG9-domain-containing protein [Fimicolochytrium jonesii]|uniref:APG9-domain-containing protein n=1 Tax=Fimicolochytrium jonesii TaxID=1396493 RepID=UPI0022FDE1F1|nr:APG9-domain-containing protein [Fimicolochytrium jonesii]KAI8823449.1 APG9-domain-containing protein [Fimicolochytrium jonesii]
MEPLNSNRRSSQFPPRGLDRLGISRRPLRERTSSFPGLSGNLGSSIGLGRPSNPKDRALRFWTQADNMDKVLISIYQYFEGKGIYSIVLSRVIKTLMKAFLVIFSTFLFFCIDYSLIHQKNMLSEIVRPSCMSFSGSGLQSLIILGIFAWFATEFVLLLKEVPRLVELSNFYTHVLGIPEGNIQTSTWADVTAVLTTLPYRRGTLNAHTVANRIMRRDNYMIALFNKDLLNFTLPVPYFRGHQFLTRITEFILLWCLWGIVFDRNWRIKKKVLEGNRREALVTELNTRFAQVALVALLCSPFLLVWLLMFFFFRYTEEFHKNPSSLGTRQYSPLAKWKFREFNELPHLFQKRLNRSYRLANKYMNQFPNSKVTSVANFVSFVTGSFLSVLIIATLLSEDLQHRFEITPARSVFFYIGIFATITAVARGMVPDENEVFEPALLLRNVIEEVRYIPDTWRDKLHTNEVRGEFGALLPFKLLLFLEEVASVAFAPIIFFYSLPTCAGEIIDFFREFTVHVDGIGYVCSFAVWDFRKFGNAKVGGVQYGAPTQGRNDYYSSKGGKMEQSFLNFKVRLAERRLPSCFMYTESDFNFPGEQSRLGSRRRGLAIPQCYPCSCGERREWESASIWALLPWCTWRSRRIL